MGRPIFYFDADGKRIRDYEAEEERDRRASLTEEDREAEDEMRAEWKYLNSMEYMREQFGDDLENYPED